MRGAAGPGRYDDPLGIYRTLYASSTRYGAYVETLAPLRPAPGIDLKNLIVENDPDLRGTPPPGDIGNWLATKHLGEGTLDGAFVDLGAVASIAFMREHMAHLFEGFENVTDFDLSVLVGADRQLTQSISRAVRQLETTNGSGVDGICYPSRLGADIVCWAIFEDADDGLGCLENPSSAPIDRRDPELVQALTDLGLKAL